MNEIERSPRAIYEDHARNHRLAYQFSPDAGRAVFYPRLTCPFGGKAALEWRISAGRGIVHSISLTYPAKGDPYTVALIDLDEGFRMMSTVTDATGDLTEIGRRVRLRFRDPDEGSDVPVAVFEWDDAA